MSPAEPEVGTPVPVGFHSWSEVALEHGTPDGSVDAPIAETVET